jgi:hypothetical protein
MIASWNLYLHDDSSVGTATRCYLLVRGTKIGQRRLTARTANCTARGGGTAFAEEIITIIANRSAQRNPAGALYMVKSHVLGQFEEIRRDIR